MEQFYETFIWSRNSPPYTEAKCSLPYSQADNYKQMNNTDKE